MKYHGVGCGSSSGGMATTTSSMAAVVWLILQSNYRGVDGSRISVGLEWGSVVLLLHSIQPECWWLPQVQHGIVMVVAMVVVWNGEAKSVTVAAPKPPRYTTLESGTPPHCYC